MVSLFLLLLGNLQRIRHAFTLGARKLKDVLSVPGETMGWKLEKFFSSSLERNGKGQRQDVEEPVVAFGTGRSEASDLRGDFEGNSKSLVYGKWFHGEGHQHKWIPQGQDASSWDIVRWFVTGQKDVFYRRNLNGSSSASLQNMRRSRGTGTYIPEMVFISFTPFTLLHSFVL